MAMTISQIMAKTPLDRKQMGKASKIIGYKAKKTVNGFPMLMAKVQCLVNSKLEAIPAHARQSYLVVIEVYKKGQVIVSCSCDDFKYRWEYALNKKGAARIEYSNGEPPVERNDAEVPGMCKHLVGFTIYLRDKGML